MEQQTCIRLATQADAAAIGTFRVEAFKASPDFRIVNAQFIEQLRWTDEDDVGKVLSVWDGGQPIATMRIDVIPDQHDLAIYSSGVMPPSDHVEWPALALARVATHAAFAKNGLNSLMRYYFLEAAVHCGARRQYGYVVVGAPRTRLMARLGYEFVPRSDEDPDLASRRPWALTWIDLHERGQQAIALLDDMIGATKQKYPWIGPSLRVPTLIRSSRLGPVSLTQPG